MSDEQPQRHTISRVPSFASSATATGSLEERDALLKSDPLEDELDDDFPRLKRACDLEACHDDEDEVNERTRLLPGKTEQSEKPKSHFRSALIWMIVNTVATVGIVRWLPPLFPFFRLFPPWSSELTACPFVPRSSPTRPSFPTPA